jgi:hypothetical protein
MSRTARTSLSMRQKRSAWGNRLTNSHLPPFTFACKLEHAAEAQRLEQSPHAPPRAKCISRRGGGSLSLATSTHPPHSPSPFLSPEGGERKEGAEGRSGSKEREQGAGAREERKGIGSFVREGPRDPLSGEGLQLPSSRSPLRPDQARTTGSVLLTAEPGPTLTRGVGMLSSARVLGAGMIPNHACAY